LQYEYRRPELEQALLNARTADALEKVLSTIGALTPDLENPEFLGRQMFCRGLDATVPVLARRLGLTDVPLTKSNDNVCIVGTMFYAHGGHSKVAEDISRLIGGERTTVVLTDIYRLRNHTGLLHPPKDAAMQRRATILLGAETLVGKVLELYNILAAIRPTRIFLLNHHFDMVALLALWPFREVVEFLHHCDHLPGLGATLPFSKHVDLTWACHEACAQADVGAVYAGMTVGVENPPAAPTAAPLNLPAKAPGIIRIATCGSLVKFRTDGLKRWADYAVAALRLPGAELVHIGPMDDELRNDIVTSLIGAGIDPERYVFAGVSSNVAADLKAGEVDVFLSSYPEPGGKANLEAMSAGLPPIVASDPDTADLMRFTFPVNAWIPIGSPAELAGAVAAARGPRRMTAEDQAAVNAELARFERYVLEPDGPPP